MKTSLLMLGIEKPRLADLFQEHNNVLDTKVRINALLWGF